MQLVPILDTSAGPTKEEMLPHVGPDFSPSANFEYQSGPLMRWLQSEEVPTGFIESLRIIAVPTSTLVGRVLVLIITRYRTEDGRKIAVGAQGIPQTTIEVYGVSTAPPEPPGGFRW